MSHDTEKKPETQSATADMVQVGIYMLPEHKDWLKSYAKRLGETGYTAAIRHLIRSKMDEEKATAMQPIDTNA